MAHEAPTTKEDTILESLKQLSEIELEAVLSGLYTHLEKENSTHVMDDTCGMGQRIEELESTLRNFQKTIDRLL